MAQSIKVFEKDDEGNWHPICQSFGFPGTPPLSPPSSCSVSVQTLTDDATTFNLHTKSF